MQRAVKNARLYSFLPNSDLSAELGRNLCRDRVIATAVCENILLFLAGFGSTQINAVSYLFIYLLNLLGTYNGNGKKSHS
jgi:hypothetical protein